MSEDTAPYRTKPIPMKLNVRYLGKEEFYPSEHLFEVHTEDTPLVSMIKVKEIKPIPDFDPQQFNNYIQSYFNAVWQRQMNLKTM